MACLEQLAKKGDKVCPFADTVKRLKRPIDELAELGPLPAGLGVHELGIRCRTASHQDEQSIADIRGTLLSLMAWSSRSREAVELERCLVTADACADVVSSCVDG